MRKVYFITRSYPNVGNSNGGGALAREAQVKVLLKLGYEVKVIAPNPNEQNKTWDNVVQVGFKWNKKIESIKERLGFNIDTYQNWSYAILKQFKNIIKKEDIVFGVTGGSADTFLAGYLLKKYTGCKLVLSYHDPINYTEVNGLYVDNKINARRNRFEKKIIEASDLIFTSSLSFKERLFNKFKGIEYKTANFYFGFNKLEKLNIKSYQLPFTIAYAGSFNKHQSPEILINITSNLINIKRLFLGYYKNYLPIQKFINEEFKGALSHDEFLIFSKKNIDIGFVSLTSEYLSVCFPSKIFEYINLGLPILAALPNSDSMVFINKTEIGKAFHYSDIEGMSNYLKNLTPEILNKQRENMLKLKEEYFYQNSLIGMGKYLENLNNIVN